MSVAESPSSGMGAGGGGGVYSLKTRKRENDVFVGVFFARVRIM